jgi:hypothetical protein
MPITLRISGEEKAPKVEVKELGIVNLRKEGFEYVGEFWSQKPGKYQISVHGDNIIWRSVINIENQEYLSFNQEMTVFCGLLLACAIGLVIWMKRIKKI